MTLVPTLHYRLPHREPGAFGTSKFGRIAEWVTNTWPRFNVLMCWIFIVAMLIIGPGRLPSPAPMLFLVSPLAAVILYVAIVIVGWIFYVVPKVNVVVGVARLAYLWLFCRLVVQRAPTIEIPAWISRK